MEIMTIAQVAEALQVSRGTVYRYIDALKYEDAIKAGEKTEADVPSSVKGYMGLGFPRVFYLSPSIPRFKREEVEAWIRQRADGVAAA